MIDVMDMVGISVVILMIALLFYMLRRKIVYDRRMMSIYQNSLAHQQEDIYNISSRVQDQWPTHDAHLSIDHISILNQMNKSMYNDAPPSYDEVMKTAIQTNGEASTPTAVIVEAPKAISTTTSLRQQ
ncbi:unnamed protein product [Psylliodes chrysocephalus]|uniref:Uncharacterized protein n=1 Tax=Psylliodes chrysocephalus TaxID=3402493 RepID=A0A9P0CUD2_9CUCU|nr:unnamed protein product [Psylliodes chrysocephala]